MTGVPVRAVDRPRGIASFRIQGVWWGFGSTRIGDDGVPRVPRDPVLARDLGLGSFQRAYESVIGNALEHNERVEIAESPWMIGVDGSAVTP
jgi:hypothetical protein